MLCSSSNCVFISISKHRLIASSLITIINACTRLLTVQLEDVEDMLDPETLASLIHDEDQKYEEFLDAAVE